MGKSIKNKKTMTVAMSVLVATAITLIVTLCLVFLLESDAAVSEDEGICTDTCKLTLVETISQNLTYPEGSPTHMETYDSWSHLLDMALNHVDLASYYWTMLPEDVDYDDPSSAPGSDIFHRLTELDDHGVKLKIVETSPAWSNDTKILEEEAAAEVRRLDFAALGLQYGIIHTKMWVVDEKHFYIGSANFDWRALTQVKEMGIMIEDCGCLGRDVQKTFDAYWLTQGEGSAITDWPDYMTTKINLQKPILLQTAGLNETAFLSVAPPSLESPGRTSDLDAVLHIIDNAQQFIYIALMDYFPVYLYRDINPYWAIIDDRLRAAAYDRGVQVRLMPAWWKYSRQSAINFLESLTAISPAISNGGSIEAKLFEVPEFTEAQANIPYSRVNHNKYMVTETTAFITTSNWSGDYFSDTGAVSITITQTAGSTSSDKNIHIQLRKVFDRDWNSQWAHNISEYKKN